MSELAAAIDFARPDLVLEDRHNVMIKTIRDTYIGYRAEIDKVGDTVHFKVGRARLREIEAEMQTRFTFLVDQVFYNELEGGEPLASDAAGREIVIRRGDLGAALKDDLPRELVVGHFEILNTAFLGGLILSHFSAMSEHTAFISLNL